ATAFFASRLAGERPSGRFWLAAAAGSSAVVVFALHESGWVVRSEDSILVAASILCGLAYAQGGRVARELGGRAAITWALIFAFPFVAAAVAWSAIRAGGLHASFGGWAAFGYTGVMSMFFSFWAWYEGLAQGGISRVGQLQLLQVFLTLAWSRWLLRE